MSRTCPSGHPTAATDYCDTCGAPVAVGGGGASTGGASTGGVGGQSGSDPLPDGPVTGQSCPHCQAQNPAGALFCESCGYDFTTGAFPRTEAATVISPVPDPADWVAEVWVDPDWYAEQESDEPCPSPGLPVVVHLTGRGGLVGRRSSSRNIYPEIDCSTDVGVSRRQTELSTDGTRWWVEDLESANGTYVGSAADPLPTEPLPPGQRRELAEDDRVYVGAWTRIVIRPATDQERTA